jgi:hypothetical protein
MLNVAITHGPDDTELPAIGLGQMSALRGVEMGVVSWSDEQAREGEA